MNRQQQKHEMLITFMANLTPAKRREAKKISVAGWHRYLSFINNRLLRAGRVRKRKTCASCAYTINVDFRQAYNYAAQEINC
jgi:hypothetical protein